MTVSRLDVRTDDGVMDAYLHLPPGQPAEGGEPLATVIMFPDALGVRPASQEMAERLAAAGYAVVLPNIMYRTPDAGPFDAATVFADPETRAKLGVVMQKANATAVMRDTEALLATLDAVPAVSSDKVGTIGYCMGGRLAFAAAGALPDRVAAAAAFHGGRLAVEDDPESPHKRAGAVRARLYFGVADNDGSCTPEDQARLAAALEAAKVDYRLELYPGALHGFAVHDLPVYDEAAAERHWERATELFGDTLGASSA